MFIVLRLQLVFIDYKSLQTKSNNYMTLRLKMSHQMSRNPRAIELKS